MNGDTACQSLATAIKMFSTSYVLGATPLHDKRNTNSGLSQVSFLLPTSGQCCPERITADNDS